MPPVTVLSVNEVPPSVAICEKPLDAFVLRWIVYHPAPDEPVHDRFMLFAVGVADKPVGEDGGEGGGSAGLKEA